MKPVDPRLLRHARASRGFLAASVLLGLVGAVLLVAQATLIAEIVVSAFQRGLSTEQLRTRLLLLVAVAAGRAAVSWLTELAAHRASAAVKSQLRAKLLGHAALLGPTTALRGGAPAPGPRGPYPADEDAARPRTERVGELVTLATRGIDALDGYFARYLPQLGLAVVVPVVVLARIVTADWVSALIIALTLPLIPLFMALIGWATQSSMDRQWRTLSRLSGHFLDVVAGLPTLKVFGRAKAQAESVRRITADYRRAALRTLRIAFLSSFALELLATISVALVAVGIGMRLVHGDLDLYTGLLVLVLAPEAYLPLRQVGAEYHAAVEGLAAAADVFALLETPVPETGGGAPRGNAPDLTRGPVRIAFEGLTVHHPGRTEPSLPATSFTVEPGEVLALTGPSGAGKSTLLQVLLGFTPPSGGRVTVGGAPLGSLDLDAWRAQIAWVPQHPHLFAGTIAENVTLARPDATPGDLRRALRDAGLLALVAALPDGAATRIGEDGMGLSAGQRQRIALARAFLADRPLLLLDEPTANLDGETEAGITEAVGRLSRSRTVLLVVHRPALLAIADRTFALTRGPAAGEPSAGQLVAGHASTAEHPSAGQAMPGRPSPERPSAGRSMAAGAPCSAGAHPVAGRSGAAGDHFVVGHSAAGRGAVAGGWTLAGSSGAEEPEAGQAMAERPTAVGSLPAAGAPVAEWEGPVAGDGVVAGHASAAEHLEVAGARPVAERSGALMLTRGFAEGQPAAGHLRAAEGHPAAGLPAAVDCMAEHLDVAGAHPAAVDGHPASAHPASGPPSPAALGPSNNPPGLSEDPSGPSKNLLGPSTNAPGLSEDPSGPSKNLLGPSMIASGLSEGPSNASKNAAPGRSGNPPGASANNPSPSASTPTPSERGRVTREPGARSPLAVRGPFVGRFGLAALLGALALGSAVGLMATSGYLISRASQQPPVLYLMVAVTATRAFGIGRAAFRYAERLVSHDATFRVLADLRAAVYRGLTRIAPAGLGKARRGDLLSRLVADVDSLQDHFLRWLLPAASAATVGVAACGFLGWVLPEAGLLLAAGLLIGGVLVPWLAGALSRRTERRLAPARGELSTRVTDLLTGTAELTVAGALPARLGAAGDADALLTRLAARSSATAALGAGLTTLTTGLTVAACAFAGVGAVHQGRLSGVLLAVVVLTPLAAFEAVAGMPLAAQHRQRARRAAERVNEVLRAPEPVTEPAEPRPLPAAPLPVSVRGLTARYPGQAVPALSGVDLELAAGRRIAVVGPSGSGKTTLAQVLLRFLDPEAGTMTLGGGDARTFAGDDVRRVVGLCGQDAHIFDSSIRENLRLASPGCAEADLRGALARARLLDWVETLPEGLDTMVGEHGARLSGGQRQRLALARALLADFPVLVLDEPAEHLDLPTADALTADLLAATEGRTTLLITHRLAGLAAPGAVDEVVVLDAGRVVQRGSWAELSAVEGPLRELWLREEAADLLTRPRPREAAVTGAR